MLVLLQVESFAFYVARPGEGFRFVLSLPFMQLENLAIAGMLGGAAALLPGRVSRWAPSHSWAQQISTRSSIRSPTSSSSTTSGRPGAKGRHRAPDSSLTPSGPRPAGRWPRTSPWCRGRPVASPRARRRAIAGVATPPPAPPRSRAGAHRGERRSPPRDPRFSTSIITRSITLLGDLPRAARTGAPAAAASAGPLAACDAPSTTPARPGRARRAHSHRAGGARSRPDAPAQHRAPRPRVGGRAPAPRPRAGSPHRRRRVAERGDDALPARAGGHGLLLDSVYTSFPGTMRSHVALQMGGRTITYGRRPGRILYRTRAPNLVGELQARGYGHGLLLPGRRALREPGPLLRGLRFDPQRSPRDARPRLPASPPGELLGHGGGAVRRSRGGLGRERCGSVPFSLLPHALHAPPPRDPCRLEGPVPRRDGARALRERAPLHGCDGAEAHLGMLETRGLMETPSVVVTGDHGEAFAGATPGTSCTTTIYDENVRNVPPPPPTSPAHSPPRELARGGDRRPHAVALLGPRGRAPRPGPGRRRSRSGSPLGLLPPADRLLPQDRLFPRSGACGRALEVIRASAGGDRAGLSTRDRPGRATNLASVHPEMVATYHQRA